MKTISAKKQQLIDEKNNSPLTEGEKVYVFEKAITTYKKDSEKSKLCIITKIDNSDIYVKEEGYPTIYKITKDDIASRYLITVGANPFENSKDYVRTVAFSLESIIHALNIDGESTRNYDIKGVKVESSNWNPFVYVDGEKKYYQRPFVWTLSDNQNLIESIYQNIDCGKVLVRKRGWDELEKMVEKGETEVFFTDIVDGKQRMNAIRGFIHDEYPDLNGNYYSDLSAKSQHLFLNHQLFSYAEMPENTKDGDVLTQFLKLNFAGVPQSIEHIEFVKSLRK